MQLTHYQSKFTKQTFPIVLVCDGVIKAPNIGSLLRLSDAFGIEKLILCGAGVPIGKRMTKTSRSTEKYVNFKVQPHALDVVKSLKANNFQIISVEITENSQPLNNFKLSAKKPIAIVIGSENFGVNDTVIELSDYILHINMYGHNSSMSVVQAGAVALYEITNQLSKTR
jgi:tRNA G18 (ribose-2'-O)-methylase SpoU